MYKPYKNNCFCLKPTPPISESTDMESSDPKGGEAHSNNNVNQEQHIVKDFSNSIPTTKPSTSDGMFGYKKFRSGANSANGTADENNKMVQCEGCKHEEYFEWCWDKSLSLTSTSVFDESDRSILFNPGFSVGTGAVRGTIPLEHGKHHFFEILMNTEVYGTDMMIGVGTEKVDLHRFSHSFVHFLGYDNESYGLSYSGDIHHGGHIKSYTKPFSQGTYVGVHVDLWSGTLQYYINRKPMGKAFTGLHNKVLYPMISSTAARSGMCLSYCRSFTSSLQLQALLAIGTHSYYPENLSIFNCPIDLPPGLRSQIKKTYWWISSNRREIEKKDCMEEDKENQCSTAKQSPTPTATSSTSSNTNAGTSYPNPPSSRDRERLSRRRYFFASLGFALYGGCGERSEPSTSGNGNSTSSIAPSTSTVTTVSPYSSATNTYTESHSTASGATNTDEGGSSSSVSSPPLTPDSKRIRLRTSISNSETSDE